VGKQSPESRVAPTGSSRVGAAVSGGADSVFLLHALHRLGHASCILHVNHALRGAESDAEEAFVRDLGAQFNLPVHVRRIPPPAEGNLEQEARRARYAFFTEAIAGGLCDIVATGHTRDDQAETILYRFLRGAGTAGLSGIRPRTDTGIVRPLLEIGRDEIRAWLRENGFEWREDSSNLDHGFARNRIRLRHLPELTRDLNPALPETLAVTARWAQGEEDYWEAELDRLAPIYLTVTPETVLIETARFNTLATAVQRRLLRRAIARVRGSLRGIEFPHVEVIRDLMQSGAGSGRIQIPGLDIYRSFDWLRLAPPGIDNRNPRDFEIPLQIPGVTREPQRGIVIEVERTDHANVYNREMNELDGVKCTGSLSLRNWRPGDRFQPGHCSGAEKIKTLFQIARVPLWERRTWPVIARGDAIVWTRTFGASKEFAPGPESRLVLRIREPNRESKPRELKESAGRDFTSMQLKRAGSLTTTGEQPGERSAEVS
jgi:tRNA(Ile)-lysidine synthase